MVLEGPIDRKIIGQLATITWESELLPIIAVTVADEHVEMLKALPGVVRVEEPKVGTVML